MRIAPKRVVVAFIAVLECQDCHRHQVAYFTDGADRYPVVESECAACGAWEADQLGPPIFTLN